MKRTAIAEKPPEYYAVSTFGGNSILHGQTPVWTVVEDKAVMKRAEDLKPGDKVLSVNTPVKVSLEDIKNALRQDDLKYKLAHANLHAYSQNHGKEIPRLQAFLSAALQKGGFEPSELEDEKKLSKAVDFIYNQLEKTEQRARGINPAKTWDVSRSKPAIREWITGETVLPKDSATLRALRRLNSQKFDELFGPEKLLKQGEESPLLWAHKHWSTTHSVLRNWIAGFSPKALASEGERFEIPTEEELASKQGKEAGDSREHKSFAEERRLVYEKLVKPLWEATPTTPEKAMQYAFVRVRNITPVQKEKGKTKPNAPVLSKGVVTATKTNPAELGMETTTFGNLEQEYQILFHMTKKMLDNQLVRRLDNSNQPAVETGHGLAILNAMTFESFAPKQFAKMFADDQKEPVWFATDSRITGRTWIPFEKNDALEMIREGYEKIGSSEAERKLGLPDGIFLRIVERLKILSRTIPTRKEKDELSHIFGQRGPYLTSETKYSAEEKRALSRIARKLRYYSVAAMSLPIPDKVDNFKTMQDVENYMSASSRLQKASGMKDELIAAYPPSEKEVRETLGFLNLTSSQESKILGIYGWHNFIA
ncbi:MAG TPA: hypothetical protein VI875_00920 [Candidatus Norongarragalinales archaeon]|nr:hypothetical protein [Candidatus Norongarragalinales archaeon]